MKSFVLMNVPSGAEAYHNFRSFVQVPPPIGLATIAAVLEAMGYQVRIVDGEAERWSMEQTVDRIAELKPDYVGSTTMTAAMDLTERFYRLLKGKCPNAVTVVGGPHASALPVRTLEECEAIDVVVVGEGEDTVREMMPVLDAGGDLSGVQGLAFRKEGRIVRTPGRPPIRDLSASPIPAYHLLTFDRYYSYGWNRWVAGHREPFGCISTSRGCFGTCNFCAAHCVHGRGARYFPVERIKRELDVLVNTYKVRVLYFNDDTFTSNRKVVHEVCDYLIEKGYNRQLEIQVSARVDTVNVETFRKMRQAGIRWVFFGFESGNQDVLNRMGKRVTVEQIRASVDVCLQAGLLPGGNFILGNLGETRETAMDTIRLACQMKLVYASFAIAIPLPGSELYQYCLDHDIPLPSWTDFGNVNTPPIPLNESLSALQLMELRRLATKRFFMRPAYVLRALSAFKVLPFTSDLATMYFAFRKEVKANRY